MKGGDLPEGYMGKRCRKWLKSMAKRHRRIIEVGVWKGRSTVLMAHHTRGHIWAVDNFRGSTEDGRPELTEGVVDEQGTYKAFRRNVHPYRERITLVRMDSRDAALHLFGKHGPAFDFVFIDADHSYEGVKADIDSYLPLVQDGGTLAGHDYGKDHFPGVTQAVNEAFPNATIGPSSIWSVRP
jgi:predicted O-methyltransferase YrrM